VLGELLYIIYTSEPDSLRTANDVLGQLYVDDTQATCTVWHLIPSLPERQFDGSNSHDFGMDVVK